MHDVWLIVIFGVMGYLLRKLNYPVAPMVLAIVLGPLAERSLRQSLLSAQGDMTVFIDRPISLTFVCLAVALFIYPIAMAAVRRRRARAASEQSG
jgi:putative tricarboxylic transport membrane protein